MIKTLAKCMGKYKKESIITPIFTAVEVFLEILIPFITASIIDKGIQAGDMRKVGIYGGIMLIIAFLSLFCGIQAGKYGAAAFCRVQRTPMRFRADAVQSTTDALKQCIFSYSRGFITTV